MWYVQESILSINTPKYLVNSFYMLPHDLYVRFVYYFCLAFPKEDKIRFSYICLYLAIHLMSKFFILYFFYFLYFFVN